ncbi:MAG TPA: tartrate dehydrogenase [Limnochordia bacterium]|nr:tartrate dehydrogenase [Limnochordia bacterium]
MKRYRIAVLPGDGIGNEVIPQALKALDLVAELNGGFGFEFTSYPWGCEYYLEHGRMLPADGMKRLADSDAILLGAIGWPEQVPDHISLRELLLRIRFEFDLYINIRPVKRLPGVQGPLRTEAPIDILFVRENSEGEYAGLGGRFKVGTPDETALQTAVFTRKGTERVMRYAFERARERRGLLLSATKSNACNYSMVFWDDVFAEISRDYPDVRTQSQHVDALAARVVTHPESLDTVVASNLFADILTDLGGALQGSLGIPVSGNIDPERRHPSMFEPVHGSAPDIAGRGQANPIAAIWSGALMLDHLGERESAAALIRSIEAVTAAGQSLTPDLGGHASTQQVTAAILVELRRIVH